MDLDNFIFDFVFIEILLLFGYFLLEEECKVYSIINIIFKSIGLDMIYIIVIYILLMRITYKVTFKC